MNSSPTAINFEIVLNLVKQLSWADQLRLLEWIAGQVKQRLADLSPQVADPETELLWEERQEIIQLMVNAGLTRQPERSFLPPTPYDAERRELAQQLGQTEGTPLSEIVIEERGPI